MTQPIEPRNFETLVGKAIDLEFAGTTFQATVDSVSRLSRHSNQERQPFSVLLLAQDESDHGQGIYRLEHPELGAQDLFLVPLGPSDGRMRYEIIFK